MSAPVFLAEDVSGDRVVLTGPEGRHAATVKRLRVGEAVDVVDGRGTRGGCTVTAVGKDTVELRVLSRTAEPVPAPRLVLVQALAKGDRGELAVELATEVGIDEVVPWSAARSVVRWDGERGQKALSRWRSTSREAAKQSRRAWVPEVTEAQSTAQVVELARTAACTFVLHEEAVAPLAQQPVPVEGDVLLVVGPEGGITPEELAAFTAVGAVAVRLGTSVLRTSTAGAAAAAVVSARTARWR
ncbi:MAG: 16S rRNA (uracil(1498)-N(3))-methyltransferase [Actinobacteria bacterium]|nr:16S rRNA (uracil(1498)-N(3))-methyltransferase [Actinomycetota bacterium]MCA1721795.1 16S rRNA (uracil(1498)-N(3))-methyltransferase [Actinomycetota bacterium]